MESTYDNEWVEQMAELLVCEITELISGIQLKRTTAPAQEPAGKKWEAIYGFVDGEYQIELRFLAEHSMFFRLAQNMMGSEPEDSEVEEYAMEFFNVLCGRFISEIYTVADRPVRFIPIRYELVPDAAILGAQESLCTVHFCSDKQEMAAFSWTATPIKDLLRRSMHDKA